MRLYLAAGRHAAAVWVDPDSGYALALRARDVPFEVVAHHPSVGWLHSEGSEGPPVDPRVGLAEADLAFDQNRVEQRRQLEALDLDPLQAAAAVCQQRKPAPLIAQPLHGGHRIVDRLDRLVAK